MPKSSCYRKNDGTLQLDLRSCANAAFWRRSVRNVYYLLGEGTSMFNFFRKKRKLIPDLYSLDYQYNQLLQMSIACPERTKVEQTTDFEIKFIDCGFYYDDYNGDKITTDSIIYTSKALIKLPSDTSPQIHYGVLNFQDHFSLVEFYYSSNHLPEQVKRHLRTHGRLWETIWG